MRRHRCPFSGGVGGLEAGLVLGECPRPSPRSRAGSRSFPAASQGLREGRLSLDQVGVIAARAGAGSDEHYAQLAAVATVNQLRTAVKLEPRPDPDPRPEPRRSITKTADEQSTSWRITLPHDEAATFDAALQSHREALIAEWKHDHDTGSLRAVRRRCRTPWTRSCVWSRPAGTPKPPRRPHGQHTTVVVHVDVEARAAALHLGPLLSDAERQYLTCDATCEVWFERDGRPIGVGPGHPHGQPAATPRPGAPRPQLRGPGLRGHPRLHAHHIRHWEDGGPTELDQPGAADVRSIIGRSTAATSPSPDPPKDLTATDSDGQPLQRRITRAPTHRPPTRRPALSRADRRTRRLVVVRPLPTTTQHKLD